MIKEWQSISREYSYSNGIKCDGVSGDGIKYKISPGASGAYLEGAEPAPP